MTYHTRDRQRDAERTPAQQVVGNFLPTMVSLTNDLHFRDA